VAAAVAERRPDAVLVSTPPHSIQALGVRLRLGHGIPLVADFRDDWTTNHRQRWPTPWHRWVAARRETECIATASRVLLNTPEVHRRFVARYPGRASALSVLTNGFDEEDFRGASRGLPPSPDGRLRIYYAGASYGDYMDTQLGGLAAELASSGLSDRWEIVSLGAGSWRGNGVEPVWRHLGTLGGADAARELERAAVLLLPMPPGEREPSGTVPLKAYGYLRSGRSVVYLGERGSTSELLGRFPGTHCLGRAGWNGLGAWLEARREALARHHDRPGIEDYGFGRLTARLSEHLRTAIAAG
jgi:glycosyltransferase involved in cell wall biosynthesis